MFPLKFFDLHCDTAYECYKKRLPLFDNGLAVDFRHSAKFERFSECFAIWLKDDIKNPFDFYKSVLYDFKEKSSNVPNNTDCYLTVEGGALIENEPSRVYELKKDGVCAMTLTWNGETTLAGGSDTDIPLKSTGKKVIEYLNECGMACDLSHLCEKSFWGALESAKRPYVSHTAVYGINPHKRNLKDEQLRAVREKGGIIGICFYPAFLGFENVFDGVYRNINYMLDMGLEKDIAIGSDFDGCDTGNSIHGIEDINALYEYLFKNNISKEILDDIFFNNANHFWRKFK